jgi:UDP-2-acetamido-2,6-beta-L-arabino-hexul-4-ose reductase
MLRVGITGQSGFIGTHLFNYLNIKKEEITLIPCEDSFFENQSSLEDFVGQCDTIVHLAAMNRHGDPQVIYDTNLKLVKKLIDACETTHSLPHILFSSSTQEERDNMYGRSKLDGRMLFESWAGRNNASFTGLVIPNVFGPFGNPYYNSVIATFCHQLTHDEQPRIDVDGEVKLIYVGELVEVIWQKIKDKSIKAKPKEEGGKGPSSGRTLENEGETRIRQKAETQFRNTEKGRGGDTEVVKVPHTSEKKVSEILALLKGFKENYFEKGIFPNLDNRFELNLFNTFVCYIDHSKFFPFHLKKNSDDRGTFVETVKLNSGGQVSFSTTRAGITRGNHYHTRKAERFAVIKGKARIELRRIGTGNLLSFELDGEKPSFVDMPVWFTHNITNTGTEDLFTIFWINEPYNPDDPDTFFEIV